MKKKPKDDVEWAKRKCKSCGYRLDDTCRRSNERVEEEDPACPAHTPREKQ